MHASWLWALRVMAALLAAPCVWLFRGETCQRCLVRGEPTDNFSFSECNIVDIARTRVAQRVFCVKPSLRESETSARPPVTSCDPVCGLCGCRSPHAAHTRHDACSASRERRKAPSLWSIELLIKQRTCEGGRPTRSAGEASLVAPLPEAAPGRRATRTPSRVCAQGHPRETCASLRLRERRLPRMASSPRCHRVTQGSYALPCAAALQLSARGG